jgi:adenylate kinase family enzyme
VIDDVFNPLRVSVVGTSCSGKTTLAGKLAAACGLPHFELDAIHWQPGWTPLPLEDFRRRVSEVVDGEQWVIDGNYSRVRDLVWERATDVVWIDLPFQSVLWRAIRRTSRRVITGERLFGGNRETLKNALFERDAIIYWVIRTHRRRAREYGTLFNHSAELPFRMHRVRSLDDERRLLQLLRLPKNPL